MISERKFSKYEIMLCLIGIPALNWYALYVENIIKIRD